MSEQQKVTLDVKNLDVGDVFERILALLKLSLDAAESCGTHPIDRAYWNGCVVTLTMLYPAVMNYVSEEDKQRIVDCARYERSGVHCDKDAFV